MKKVDVNTNQVIVAHGDEMEALDNQYCFISDFNWLVQDSLIQQILNNKLEIGFKLSAQVRYHQKAVECHLEKQENGKYKVIFAELVRAIAPGQSIVFYHEGHMLGGAVIQTN